MITTNAAGVVLRDAAFIKTFFGGATPVLPAPTEFLQVVDSDVPIGEKINYLALAVLKYNPISLAAVNVDKMGEAAINGDWEALRNESYNLLTLGALMKFGESPKLKRDIQLSVKNVEFLEQKLKRGVIEETPLRDIQIKLEGVAKFGIEKVERDSSGIPVEDAPPRVVSEAELLDKAQGSLEVTSNGIPESACFVGHTPVFTYNRFGYSQSRIEDILPGTLVLSRCEITGEQAYLPMINFFEHDDIEIWSVTYTDDKGDETLYTTAEHPFWVRGLGWIPVAQLKSGQILETSNPFITEQQDTDSPTKEAALAIFGRSTATVVSAKNEGYREKVYNIEVEGFHSYFVGDTGVWVHNKTRISPNSSVLERSMPDAVPHGTPAEVRIVGDAGTIAGRVAETKFAKAHDASSRCSGACRASFTLRKDC
jgi:hypothetical protein